MNWRTAPKRWGKVANRLPELVMKKTRKNESSKADYEKIKSNTKIRQ
jgi:hypothetical protein